MKFRIKERKEEHRRPVYYTQVRTGLFWWTIDSTDFEDSWIGVEDFTTRTGRCYTKADAMKLIELYKELLESRKTYTKIHKVN